MGTYECWLSRGGGSQRSLEVSMVLAIFRCE